jgi:hypothetical protein
LAGSNQLDRNLNVAACGNEHSHIWCASSTKVWAISSGRLTLRRTLRPLPLVREEVRPAQPGPTGSKQAVIRKADFISSLRPLPSKQEVQKLVDDS